MSGSLDELLTQGTWSRRTVPPGPLRRNLGSQAVDAKTLWVPANPATGGAHRSGRYWNLGTALPYDPMILPQSGSFVGGQLGVGTLGAGINSDGTADLSQAYRQSWYTVPASGHNPITMLAVVQFLPLPADSFKIFYMHGSGRGSTMWPCAYFYINTNQSIGMNVASSSTNFFGPVTTPGAVIKAGEPDPFVVIGSSRSASDHEVLVRNLRTGASERATSTTTLNGQATAYTLYESLLRPAGNNVAYSGNSRGYLFASWARGMSTFDMMQLAMDPFSIVEPERSFFALGSPASDIPGATTDTVAASDSATASTVMLDTLTDAAISGYAWSVHAELVPDATSIVVATESVQPEVYVTEVLDATSIVVATESVQPEVYVTEVLEGDVAGGDAVDGVGTFVDALTDATLGADTLVTVAELDAAAADVVEARDYAAQRLPSRRRIVWVT